MSVFSVCPYTGENQTIRFESDTRSPGWTTSGGFDPSLPFMSRDAAMKAFRRRHGKEEAVSMPQCPYTGRPVAVVERGGLWYGEGRFFRPMDRFKEREELEYGLWMRMGRSKAPKPGRRPAVKVVGEVEQRSDPTEGTQSSFDDAKHMVGGILHEGR